MGPGKKILHIPLRISIAVLLLGMLAKIFEKTYAPEIMLIGFAAIGLFYSIRFLKKQEKKFIDYTKLVLIIFWTSNGIFKIMDFPYTLFFQIVTAAAFLIWFVLEGTAYFLDEDRRAENNLSQIAWNVALIIGTLGVIAGSILRVLDWGYAIHVLSLGITIIGAYVLKDVFVPSEPKENEHNNTGYQI